MFLFKGHSPFFSPFLLKELFSSVLSIEDFCLFKKGKLLLTKRKKKKTKERLQCKYV